MAITIYLPENLLNLRLSLVHIGVIGVILLLILIFYTIFTYQGLLKRRPEEFKYL